MEIEDAVRRATDWLALSGIEGVGVGESEGQPCILVLVTSLQRIPPGIPWRFHGFPVEIRASADFRAP